MRHQNWLFLALSAMFLATSIPPEPGIAASSNRKWKLVWSDEFNGPNGSSVDPLKWTFNIGGGGWGNGELEYYTDRTVNVYQKNGALVIKAIKETYEEYWEYTSGRILTKGRFEQKYGRFEAKIKLPYGQGIWPAFWLLGADIDTVGWPKCGEIDIIENIGKEPGTIHGTIHGPGYSGGLALGAPYELTGGRIADDFHLYAIEWEPNEIRWYFDDQLYQTRTPDSLSDKTRWVFDHPFFIILNVAVGGYWPGNPDETTHFPQQMLVDYVRVYERDK